MAKKKAVSKKSGKSSSGTKKTKPVARKPSAKKTAKKAAGTSVKKTAAKATAQTAKPAAKKKTAPTAPSAKKKVKSPLSKKQLQEFRELLLEKRKSLLGDMTGIQSTTLGRNLQESSGDLSNMPTHQADIGSDNFEYEFTLGLLESERSLLKEVNEALERIEDGTFGVCLGTGEPIGIARLRARPWCKYCIEYQKMIEKGLVRPGQSSSYGSSTDDKDEPDEQEEEEIEGHEDREDREDRENPED